MKVLFDHQAFCMQRYGGVSRSFVEIYERLPKDVQATIALKECNNAYIREMNLCPAESDAYNRWIYPGNWPAKGRLFNVYNWLIGNRTYWDKNSYNRKESIRLLKEGNFDVFHPTFFDDYFLPYLNGKPFVLTIHDMMPELYPQFFDQENDSQILGKRKLAPLASAIIAVSENTKSDVIRILGVPEEKVKVVYHGSEHIKVPSSSTSMKYQNPLGTSPYVLYVGDRTAYKNFDLFVDAITPVLCKYPEVKVICTGIPFNQKEFRQIEKLGLKDRFISHWIQKDEEFYFLYHNAICFVYSSEYEGFGIPILEAYKADCPVMLNNASCFPEIAGEAGVYFELTKSRSNFVSQFEKVYSWSEKERECFLKKQQDRLKLYSWEKTAHQMADIYASVIHH